VLRKSLGEDASPEAERAAFSRNYPETAAALGAPDKGAAGLVLAWREFHESIVDETETPIRNTNRPSAFFGRVGPRQARLVFWSNLLVGLGLLLTFLGLIVALHTAKEGMYQGASPAQMQDSLRQLLTVAGAKFFTSVAGVGGSLILRAAERNITRKTSRAVEEFCSLLERGLLYVPPQRLAAEQLAELREQTAQLKTFNTDFALQVSERMGAHFQQAIAPLSTSLATLNTNITGMGQSLRDGLGQGAADAINQATSGELRALGQTLATLGERLDTLSSTVGASGDVAAQQIRAAGADFAQAASDIKEAFGELAGQVSGLGTRLNEQSEATSRAQDEMLARVINGLTDAQQRSASAINSAVDALSEAGALAAGRLEEGLTGALAKGVADGNAVFKTAIEESGASLQGAASELSRAVSEAASQIERAQKAFERSGESAARTAEAIDGVTGQAKNVTAALGDAAKGFATAAAPVAQAAQGLNEAAGRVARAIEAGRETDADALRALSALAEQVRETQATAEEAWSAYQERFEDVDKSLGEAAAGLGQTLSDSFDQFRGFAQSFDAEMAKAVSRLSSSLTAIEEYAGALDEYAHSMRGEVSE
jgi:hypothetical protein